MQFRSLTFSAALLSGLCGSVALAHELIPGQEAPAQARTAVARVRTGNGMYQFESIPGWCQTPGAVHVGSTHGGIVVDKAGNIYFTTDTKRSIVVQAPDGKYLRDFAADFVGIHALTLREEDGQEYLYAAHLHGKQVVKFKTSGEVVWTLGWPEKSGLYAKREEYNPTAVTVGPNGDIYVADGYGKSYIHRYNKDREYLKSFGGPKELKTCHGIALDTRGEKPLLLVSDRENRRLVHYDLDGNFVRVAVGGLRRPCAVSIRGDFVAVAELEGRVTLLDKDNFPVAFLGDNPQRPQWANFGVDPKDWREAVFTAPHSVCYDADGNLLVMDWNAAGRLSKLAKVN